MYARGCFRKPQRVGSRDIYQFSHAGRTVLVVDCLVHGVRVWIDAVEVARGSVEFAQVIWHRSDDSFRGELAAQCARLVCSQFVFN